MVDDPDVRMPGAEFQTWHVFDAGGPTPSLKVRFREGVEMPGGRDGPDIFTALQDAERQGGRAYNREPRQWWESPPSRTRSVGGERIGKAGQVPCQS